MAMKWNCNTYCCPNRDAKRLPAKLNKEYKQARPLMTFANLCPTIFTETASGRKGNQQHPTSLWSKGHTAISQ